jgi:hypothetical protein
VPNGYFQQYLPLISGLPDGVWSRAVGRVAQHWTAAFPFRSCTAGFGPIADWQLSKEKYG